MMRKFFYFFALSAIVLGMASCDGNDPANKKFQITADRDYNYHGIEVSVASKDQNKYFYYGLMKASIFLQRPVVYVNSELSNLSQGNFPEGLYSGNEGKSYKNLLEGTDYAAFACEVDENYQIVGEVEYVLVRTAGPLQGRFTINSSGNKVRFARGNLQDCIDDDNVRMATEQWELVQNDGKKWEDLLAWSITQKNPIYVGNDDGAYRVLTDAEWDYLLNTRSNATNFRGTATVNGKHGLVILPDNWSAPASPKFTATTKNWTTNQYSAENWAILEDAGAVFLPAAGFWDNGSVHNLDDIGYYWTASKSKPDGKNKYVAFATTGLISPIVFVGIDVTKPFAAIRCVQDVK